MLLAVDVGNTNLTTGLVRDGRLVATRRASSHLRFTDDELEVAIEGLLRLDGASLDDAATIVLASVVPALTAAGCG